MYGVRINAFFFQVIELLVVHTNDLQFKIRK